MKSQEEKKTAVMSQEKKRKVKTGLSKKKIKEDEKTDAAKNWKN